MKKKDLTKLIYTATNKQLLKYLQEEYSFYQGKDRGHFKGRLNELKQLDLDTIKFGIARMEEIQEERNLIPSLSSLVTLLLAMIATYATIFSDVKIGSLTLASIFSLLTIFIITYKIISTLTEARLSKSKASLFKNLLVYCEELKKQ